MSNPFAAIETTLNRVATSALANATVAWGGFSASAVFSVEYAETLGMANSAPVLRVRAEDFPALATGETVSVDYADTLTDYVVRAIEADGTGLLRLVLEAA